MRRQAVPFTALMVVLLIGGCGGPAGGQNDFRDVPTRVSDAQLTGLKGCPRDRSVLDGDDDVRPRAGLAPAGFEPTTVIRCSELDDIVTGDQRRIRVAEDRAPTSTALLAALRLPDQEFADSHAACAAVAVPFLRTYLADRAGRVIRARLPDNPCGDPRAEVSEELQKLAWSSRRVYRLEVPIAG